MSYEETRLSWMEIAVLMAIAIIFCIIMAIMFSLAGCEDRPEAVISQPDNGLVFTAPASWEMMQAVMDLLVSHKDEMAAKGFEVTRVNRFVVVSRIEDSKAEWGKTPLIFSKSGQVR